VVGLDLFNVVCELVGCLDFRPPLINKTLDRFIEPLKQIEGPVPGFKKNLSVRGHIKCSGHAVEPQRFVYCMTHRTFRLLDLRDAIIPLKALCHGKIGQILLGSRCCPLVSLSRSGLDEYHVVILTGLAFGGNKNGRIHGGLERVALPQIKKTILLKQLPHPQLARKGKEGIGYNKPEDPVWSEQVKTQISEMDIEILQVACPA